jgi:hypothetical protein
MARAATPPQARAPFFALAAPFMGSTAAAPIPYTVMVREGGPPTTLQRFRVEKQSWVVCLRRP